MTTAPTAAPVLAAVASAVSPALAAIAFARVTTAVCCLITVTCTGEGYITTRTAILQYNGTSVRTGVHTWEFNVVRVGPSPAASRSSTNGDRRLNSGTASCTHRFDGRGSYDGSSISSTVGTGIPGGHRPVIFDRCASFLSPAWPTETVHTLPNSSLQSHSVGQGTQYTKIHPNIPAAECTRSVCCRICAFQLYERKPGTTVVSTPKTRHNWHRASLTLHPSRYGVLKTHGQTLLVRIPPVEL